MKKILQHVLRTLARRVLLRYRPAVVGITGSIGKTSTKEAIFTVLQKRYRCRRNQKNYNNEIGVPLTILGTETGKKNPLAWLRIIGRGLWLAYGSAVDYPKTIILEMGADHPGDIAYLVKFTRPVIGVVTAVGPVHLEFFSKIEQIAREKGKLITALPTNGTAILNADDDLVIPMREKTAAHIVTYGFGEEAMVRAHDLRYRSEAGNAVTLGVSFKVTYAGSTFPVSLPHVLGKHQIYPALAALAVGFSLKLNAVEISELLKEYRPPAGRMNLIPGQRGTQLIDDSYNSSPAAAISALKTLAQLPRTGQKYALLGDMAELGAYTVQGHREVGETAATCTDVLVTVGDHAKRTAAAAADKGLAKDNIFSFDTVEQASAFMLTRLKAGDVILIKGSQVARLEKAVKALMAEPARAAELLVRQGSGWDK